MPLETSDFGFIGYINHGCRGVKASNNAAFGGNIGYIKHGCRGVGACVRAARDRSNIDGISYACNNITT